MIRLVLTTSLELASLLVFGSMIALWAAALAPAAS
jgi:hypothetical protein